jgi:hypothetical protein
MRGGSLGLLRPFVNVASDEAWHLLVGVLAAALRRRGPYVVLVLLGEHESAKSATFLNNLADRRMTLNEVGALTEVLIPQPPAVERSCGPIGRAICWWTCSAAAPICRTCRSAPARPIRRQSRGRTRPALRGLRSVRRCRSGGRGAHRWQCRRPEVPGRRAPVQGMSDLLTRDSSEDSLNSVPSRRVARIIRPRSSAGLHGAA